jgi:hypothetical protein
VWKLQASAPIVQCLPDSSISQAIPDEAITQVIAQEAMTQQRCHQLQQSYRAEMAVFVTYKAK